MYTRPQTDQILHALHREKEKAILVFEGVDTISTISLNGVTIGKTDNMFRRYVNE